MRNILSISLPNEILRELKIETKKENSTISEVVRKALKDYFFKSEFERARKKVQLENAKKGIKFSEEEILEQFS